MARIYSNENIAIQVVRELRRLGHDVLTSLEAGRANAAVPDAEVLAFAAAENRILLSHNRRHFFVWISIGQTTTRGWSYAPSILISKGWHNESTIR